MEQRNTHKKRTKQTEMRGAPRNRRAFCGPALMMVVVFALINGLVLFKYPARQPTAPNTNKGNIARSGKDDVAGGAPVIHVLQPVVPTPPPRSHQSDARDGDPKALDLRVQSPELVHPDTEKWPDVDLEAMLQRTVPRKAWGRPLAEQSALAVETVTRARTLSGCNPIDVPFNPSEDDACIRTMTNTSLWAELLPEPMRYDSRTIKFRIRFADAAGGAALESIVKVPQRLFPYEAFSEVAAYHADRVLGVRRIPPTGWACIPTRMIRMAVALHAEGLETIDDFLKDSHAANFADWVDRDLFQYAAENQLLERNGANGGGEECVGASIQSRVADAVHLLDSTLRIPYIPHNASWHKHFDLTTSGRVLFAEKKYVASLVHIADVNAFDFVTGNHDRSPNKNNFVVGGCASKCRARRQEEEQEERLVHPGHPTFVHLDQGMAFYGTPNTNPITLAIKRKKKEGVDNTFCLFRAPTVNQLYKMAEPDATQPELSVFHTAMTARVASSPRAIRGFLSESKLRDCTKRIRQLLAVVESCLKQPFSRWVIAP